MKIVTITESSIFYVSTYKKNRNIRASILTGSVARMNKNSQNIDAN